MKSKDFKRRNYDVSSSTTIENKMIAREIRWKYFQLTLAIVLIFVFFRLFALPNDVIVNLVRVAITLLIIIAIEEYYSSWKIINMDVIRKRVLNLAPNFSSEKAFVNYYTKRMLQETEELQKEIKFEIDCNDMYIINYYYNLEMIMIYFQADEVAPFITAGCLLSALLEPNGWKLQPQGWKRATKLKVLQFNQTLAILVAIRILNVNIPENEKNSCIKNLNILCDGLIKKGKFGTIEAILDVQKELGVIYRKYATPDAPYK